MFEIETTDSKETYYQVWNNFKSSKPDVKTKAKGKATGTKVGFIPNASVFDNSKWDYATIRTYLCLRKRVLETEEKTSSLKIEFIWDEKNEMISSELKPDWSAKNTIGELLIWEKKQDSGSFSFVNSALCTGIHQKIVYDGFWPDYDAINKFIISMNMPKMYGKETVSVYLASYYPMTYNAFLDGKPKEYLYRLIVKEKKRKNGKESNPFVKEKHSYERTKDSMVRRISMRGLSKAHDWKTVK
jgi:hypothetical protein